MSNHSGAAAAATRSLASTTVGSKSKSSTTTTRLPWCCTASIEVEADDDNGGDGVRVRIELPHSFVDMSDWMRGIETAEGRGLDAVGAGVYDTWRCDRVLLQPGRAPDRSDLPSTSSSTSLASLSTTWNQWGADFHLNRLANSYRDAVRLFAVDTHEDEKAAVAPTFNSIHSVDESAICQALSRSRRMVRDMLQEADDRLSHVSDPDNWSAQLTTDDSKDAALFQLVRVTLLWSALNASTTRGTVPPSSSKIVIRGHACYTGPIQNIYQPHAPITVSLAMDSPKSPAPILTEAKVGVSHELSRVNHHPHLKLAKWTRLRRDIPRPPGVGEVLLTRRIRDGRVEILEGLSSNAFFVYENGTVRTANDGVLHGYVRQLVLECLEECGLSLDPQPVWLDEPERWSEVIITSSSRLIYPVSTILIPEGRSANEARTYREVWKRISEQPPPRCQKWQCLLQAILRRGGYTSA